MSQLTEREQGENTDEGKSAFGKDHFDDQALETQSCTDIISELGEEVNELNENQQETISDLEEEVNKVIDNQQKRISDLEEKVNKVIDNQQKRISKLEEKVNEAERKLNLWLYGLQEQEGENVKRRVIDICRNVVPGAAYIFPLHIDTVQRIGKKGEGKVRPVIIRFIARSTKELLWKTSKSSEFHRSSSLKFAEDLTLEDKDTRFRLWPLIEAARKEGKIAYFAGAKAIIDGKEIRE